jgi:hypothetical protein
MAIDEQRLAMDGQRLLGQDDVAAGLRCLLRLLRGRKESKGNEPEAGEEKSRHERTREVGGERIVQNETRADKPSPATGACPFERNERTALYGYNRLDIASVTSGRS